MKSNGKWRIRLAKVLTGAAIVTALFLGPQTPAQGPGHYPIHLPTDWSHRHMVFSQPSSLWQAWQLQNEPRYFHQYLRQNSWAFQSANSGAPVGSANSVDSRRERESDRDRDGDREGDGDNRNGRGNKKNALHRDWSFQLLSNVSTGGAGGSTGTGQFPAKFSFNVNDAPSCSADYVVYTTSTSGSLQIFALNNLYSSQSGGLPAGICGTTGPSVLFAYNTRISGDSSGRTRTSPVLSLDGTKVAYVESRSSGSGGSILQIVKWKSGQGTIAAPVAPTTTLTAGQSWAVNCPVGNSCVRSIVFNSASAQPDSNSSPFVNYATDELYVGDDSGRLHKFTGVFNGMPAEVVTGSGNTTTAWPLDVHGGNVLTSPVFDGTSKNIFVGDSGGQLSYVRETTSLVGTCLSGVPPCLGSPTQPIATTNSSGIVDPPIVDGSTQRVLVFAADDLNNGSVFQFDTVLSNVSKVTANVGSSSGSGVDIHAGAFDNTYLTSANKSAGHLYVCGKDSTHATSDLPAIFQLSFSAAGVLSTTVGTSLKGLSAPSDSGTDIECSPVTELQNGATDRIFFSVQDDGNTAACGFGGGADADGTACIMSINLGGSWPPGGVTNSFAANGPSGGTSGIIVDNVSGSAQASSIYYTFLTNAQDTLCNGPGSVGCAVKLTQSGFN
jgi:hypothetical protein